MKKFSIIYYSIFTIAVIFSSCKKSKLDKATTTSIDNSYAESAFNDVYKVVDETASDEDGNKSTNYYTFGNCATVNVNPAWPDSTFPKTITIDFGTTNCLGTDGNNRRGKIIYTISGRYRTLNTHIDVSLENYYLNDYKVEGTKSIINNGKNSDGHTNYTISILNGKITTPDNKIITWESTRNREWFSGEETTFMTPDTVNGGLLGINGLTDDVYHITGSASGVNSEGRSYTLTITSYLQVQFGCRWIQKGTIEIQPDELSKRTINYGNGDCDNNATVTINNKTYDILLK